MTSIVGDPDIDRGHRPAQLERRRWRRSRSRTRRGLLQCSPANTNPDLTKPEFGAPTSARRPASRTTTSASSPRTTSRVRPRRSTSTTCSARSPSTSSTTPRPSGRASPTRSRRTHGARWDRRQARRRLPKTTQDYVSIMTAAKALNPEAIYFGGVTATGGARILLAAQQAGLADVPYVGPDGINDGCGDDQGLVPEPGRGRCEERLQHRSPASATSPARPTSTRATRPSTASTPTGYAGQGFACAQVVIDALNRAGAPTGRHDARSARASAPRPSTRRDTYDHGHRRIHVRRERRHEPEDHLASTASTRPEQTGPKGNWKFDAQVDYAQ